MVGGAEVLGPGHCTSFWQCWCSRGTVQAHSQSCWQCQVPPCSMAPCAPTAALRELTCCPFWGGRGALLLVGGSCKTTVDFASMGA